jgi:hypothetical protein
LNTVKCVWGKNEIEVLGHVISHRKIMMDPKKIKAIQERLAPKNVKQLQQFLGLTNYYRRFIKDYARLAQPMFALLSKNTKFIWSEECNNAFNKLKEALVSYPVLRHPDINRNFRLHTDASGYAVGAVLCQVDEENKEYVVAYASKLLHKAELNYGISEKECLAVVFGIRNFRVYLLGTKFEVITDHSALVWLMNLKDPNGRLARWAIYLQSYDFEIIHRKGSNHTNVDALSRPVLNVELELPKEDEDESPKNLDLYEDEGLMHYMKFGRHLNGISKKQAKRIENLSNKYTYFDEIFWVKRGENDWLMVPPLKNRAEIMENEHSLGHFKAESTYKRLAEAYYWKGMRDDVEKWVKKCLVCQRNSDEAPKYHPATPITITGVCDRLGIDLIGGLPKTKRGNKWIITMVDPFSKYPVAVPLRNKTKSEVTRAYWEHWVTQFGPPKVIITDQGTEFTNSLLRELNEMIGVEHNVTAAYNPRTNGLTERFNQTLINSLRAHAEAHTEDWDLWLPFVLMCYRNRVHSVTKFSPFELMFGRKMNKFQDFSNWDELNEKMSIRNRQYEIKNLVEKIYPEVEEVIEEQQEKQAKIQNNRDTVVIEKIPIGTTVFIRIDGMINKLEPRFKGPYKIESYTKRNNYLLTDALGNKLEHSYPRHKLKVVEVDDTLPEESVEVEKILQDKKMDNNNMYLVKWKDLPESENSWVPEKYFNSMKIVNEYWQSKESEKPRKKKRRGAVNANMLLTMMLCMCLMASPISCLKVVDQFKYCETQNPSILDTSEMCKTREISRSYERKDFFTFVLGKQMFGDSILDPTDRAKFESIIRNKTELHIFSKRSHMVYGTGHECKVVKFVTKTYVSFLGERSQNTKQEIIEVTPDECKMMIKTKKCKDDVMKCEEGHCAHHAIINVEFGWLSEKTFESYSCFISPKIVSGLREDSHVFNTQCKAKDLECKLHESVVVWNNDLVYKCGVNWIDRYNFRLTEPYIISSEGHLAFQFSGITRMCGLTLAKTTEGLLLGKMVTEEIKKEKSDFEEELARRSLLMADQDYTMTEAINDVFRVRGKLCFVYKGLLNSLKGLEDKFSVINNYLGKETIIYSKGGMLFKPKCTIIKEVEFMGNEEGKCFKFPLVRFKYENKTTYGVMNADRVIIPKVERIDCKYLTNTAIKLADEEHTVIVGKEVLITNNSKMDYTKSNFYENEIHVDNLYHSKYLISSNNILDNFIDIINFKSSEQLTHTDDSFESRETSSKSRLSDLMVLFEEWKEKFMAAIIAIIIIALILICAIMIFKCYCKRKNATPVSGLNKRELELYNMLKSTKA